MDRDAQADAVVVAMHWGIAGEKIADYQFASPPPRSTPAPTPWSGTPRTLQAVETYRGRPVLTA